MHVSSMQGPVSSLTAEKHVWEACKAMFVCCMVVPRLSQQVMREAYNRPLAQTTLSQPQATGTAQKSGGALARGIGAFICRYAQVLEGDAPWPCTWTWTRRTRSAPSFSTTRNSSSTSEVTCTQNNMVNPAEELVNRRCSPTDVMKQGGMGWATRHDGRY